MDATLDKNIDLVLADALGAGRTALSEIESKQVLDALGMPIAHRPISHRAPRKRRNWPRAWISRPRSRCCRRRPPTKAKSAAWSSAWVRPPRSGPPSRIRDGLAAKLPGVRVDGVSLQAMAPPGLELIAGAAGARDARRIARRGDADDACGGAPADLDALAGLIATISQFAAAHPDVLEMNLTPVVAYVSGVRVLDARILASAFFTSGFSETGEELSVKLEGELRATALESNIALVGPNMVCTIRRSVCATFPISTWAKAATSDSSSISCLQAGSRW